MSQKMREALQAIEQALQMGFSPSDVLDENSPIRDGIREALAEQPALSVPDGWTIQRKPDNSITVQALGIGGVAVHRYATQERLIPEEVLWHLCNALLGSALGTASELSE